MGAPRKLTLEHFIQMSTGDYEPHTTEKWLVREFPTFNGVTLDPTTAEAIDLPFPVFSDIGKSVASSQVFFPSGISISGFSVTMGVDQKLRALRYVNAWSANIRNPKTGGYKTPSNYKRTIVVDLYNVKGDVIGSSELKNIWPLGLQQMQLDGEVRRNMISIQFMCDNQAFTFK